MKTDTLFYRLFLRCSQLALDLLGLPYSGDSYRFASEEIKQTAFRMDGLFKPIEDNQEHPLIFAEVQYQPDADFYGRFFSEITLYAVTVDLSGGLLEDVRTNADNGINVPNCKFHGTNHSISAGISQTAQTNRR